MPDAHLGHDVASRDDQTLVHLAAAEESLQAALKSMPNSIDSIFVDPAGDVRAITMALRDVQQVRANADLKRAAERWRAKH